MFRVVAHHSSALQCVEQSYHGLAHYGNTARALVASAGDDENLTGPVDLLLPQPCLRSDRGGVRRWKHVAQIQRPARSEPGFIECLTKPGQTHATIRTAH